ncbi:methylcytosine dioxygenase TET2-like [Poecilia formosa]|uniref:methylcytosine dioxygenase TET2-like n=1 Tax=Poecilia formosa TaxID=48698 RepID=UPI000443A4AB|nr:PREDICTED: methylcytosine dioxygenase TET2-like [Poecilia formosa]
METEEAKHEAEESLMLGQFGASHHHSHKFQNGARCSQEDSVQISDSESWITGVVHYEPSKAAGSMKRYRENCNIPTSEQALFQPGFFKMNGDLMNGELKHGFAEQSLAVHQSKKIKVDGEMKENGDSSRSFVKNFSELTKKTEMEQTSVQTDINFDIRNCHIPNRDIFSRPRNKSVPNGAVSSSSTIESTPGDLLEKTLSQYYPEQVSIAPQASGSQLDTVNVSLATRSVGEGAQPPAVTSGLPESQQQPPAASAEGVNSYNSVNYLVNGYSSNFGVNQQQQPSSCSGQEIVLGAQQHPSGAQCFPDNTNPQGTYTKTQQEYNPRSFLNHNNPSLAAEAGGYGSLLNSGANENSQNDNGAGLYHDTNMGIQYGTQAQNFQDNSGRQHQPDGQIGNSLQQQNHSVSVNGVEDAHQQRVNISCSTPSQTNWIERNLSHSQQQPTQCTASQAKEQDMWRAKPQSEQQTTSPQVQNQILEPNQAQRFRETQTQGLFTDAGRGSNGSLQKQPDCLPAHMQCAPVQHNTAPEWQQSNSKAPQMQQHLLQKMPETKNFPQNQQSNCYLSPMQSEHLHKDKDLQEILSVEFLTTQQQHCHLQRPLSHPPQFEAQQLKSPTYRPRSQPPPGQHQPQPDQPFSNNHQHTDQSAFTYNNTEMQQPQHQRQCLENSGSQNLKQFQPQQPKNHCHEPNQVNLAQTSSQSQPHLPQGLFSQQSGTRMYPKAEEQARASCAQFQTGPRLPLGPASPHADFQRHAALRMRLLQRQERHGPSQLPQSPVDSKQNLRAVKMENGPRFELPTSRQQEQPFMTRDAGMGGVKIKTENQQSLCVQDRKPGNIIASMEQSLRQYELSNLFEKKPLVVNSSNKVKVESSGPVTILSTNMDMSGADSTATAASVLKNTLDSTPKKEQLLKNFIDSPMKLLDTPVKNLLDTPMKTQYEIASCHCVDQIIEKDEGPYYTHLGSAPTVAGIRELMEKRSGITGRAIRIEKVIYTGKEGKSTQGCPIAKWVIRRSSVEEKLLVLVRERTGHRCDTACIIIVILVWEGIQPSLADRLYLELSETLTKHGADTQRRCAFNEERTCACQGFNPEAKGASFSFGCSWSMYYNGCKFARSKIPRKFKLLGDDVREEEKLEKSFQNLATLLAPLYKIMAPEAYGNQVEHEHRAPDCRLGIKEGRPFSGVTACLDFCAHAHRDLHNMQGGSTVVCTLTREDNREIGKIPEDEQLHVLPLYKASSTDEFGSEEGQQEKIKSGAIQVLSAFRRQVRMLAEPAKSCRQKKLDARKAAANKNAMLESSNDKAEKALLAKAKAGNYENTVQSTPFTGAVGAPLQSGHPSYPLGVMPQQIQQPQHQGMYPPYPSSPNAALPRFSNSPGSFPGSPKPGSMYTAQPSTPASHFLSSLPNSYMNGPNRPQPGHQCNGGMAVESYHQFYAPNQNQLDVYRQQRPAFFPEQQYGVQQRFELNYPSRYSQPGFQVNGYSAMRPPQPMRHYGPFGNNRTSDARFIDTLTGAPSVHGGMDYALAVSKANQFGEYPSSYLPQSPHIPGRDSFPMQLNTDVAMPNPQMLPAQISSGCLNPETQSGLGLPNGGQIASNIKSEPGAPQTPTTPKKPEMWSDNEHNFLDPEIGGVAVAPSHGSVLIECAKRELHATTPLKNPDRNHPTRISLVFYQHKNLNEAKHGLAMWEAKMAEKAREKEEEAERNGGEGTPSKSSKKGGKREHSESSEATGEPPYKRFIRALMEGSSSSFTTNTHVMTTPYAFTKVTGPYSQFV